MPLLTKQNRASCHFVLLMLKAVPVIVSSEAFLGSFGGKGLQNV